MRKAYHAVHRRAVHRNGRGDLEDLSTDGSGRGVGGNWRGSRLIAVPIGRLTSGPAVGRGATAIAVLRATEPVAARTEGGAALTSVTCSLIAIAVGRLTSGPAVGRGATAIAVLRATEPIIARAVGTTALTARALCEVSLLGNGGADENDEQRHDHRRL